MPGPALLQLPSSIRTHGFTICDEVTGITMEVCILDLLEGFTSVLNGPINHIYA